MHWLATGLLCATSSQRSFPSRLGKLTYPSETDAFVILRFCVCGNVRRRSCFGHSARLRPASGARGGTADRFVAPNPHQRPCRTGGQQQGGCHEEAIIAGRRCRPAGRINAGRPRPDGSRGIRFRAGPSNATVRKRGWPSRRVRLCAGPQVRAPSLRPPSRVHPPPVRPSSPVYPSPVCITPPVHASPQVRNALMRHRRWRQSAAATTSFVAALAAAPCPLYPQSGH
jgi:hypothetical protein